MAAFSLKTFRLFLSNLLFLICLFFITHLFPISSFTYSTSFSPLDVECFTENIDFYGNDLKKFKSVSNATDCQLKCQQTEGCKFWAYKTVEGKDCWLKTDNDFKEHKLNRISGPKYCGKQSIERSYLTQIRSKDHYFRDLDLILDQSFSR